MGGGNLRSSSQFARNKWKRETKVVNVITTNNYKVSLIIAFAFRVMRGWIRMSMTHSLALNRSSLRQPDFFGEITQKRAERRLLLPVSEFVADCGGVAVVEQRPHRIESLTSNKVIVGSKAIVVDERACLRGTAVGTWIIRTQVVGMRGRWGITTIE